MKIFSGSANQKLAESVAKKLNLKLLLPEKFVFPDSEERIRIREKVVGEEVAVIQPLTSPVNENLIELAFIIDALKRSGAKFITAVIPYLGYQRQDRVFRSGEAVSLVVVIKLLESVGIDRLITFDLHSIKIPELFHIQVVHLSALAIFAEKIKEIKEKNMVLVSPDMGGIRRIKLLSTKLNDMPWIAIEKNRDLATGSVQIEKISIESKVKNLKNKTVLVVDDMISAGGTIVKVTEFLKKSGVDKIFVFATHPILSQNAPTLLETSPVEKVFVTDSVFVPKEKRFPKLEILSLAQTIASNLK